MPTKDAANIPIDAQAQYPSPESFFDSIYTAFKQAEQNTENSCERYYRIAGHTIRLSFAGDCLLPRITAALTHLSCEEPASVSFTICLFDSVSTGVSIPKLPWSSQERMNPGAVRSYSNGRIFTAFDQGTGILNTLDTERNLAVFWTRDGNLLPYWESGSPLRVPLHRWLHCRGIQLLHSGAVGTAEGGVLLVGSSGSGKSTTALVCLQSELQYAADDYCLLAEEPEPFVHSLYSSGKVNASNIGRFNSLRSALSNADKLDQEKALFFLHTDFKHKISRGFPLKAILVPRVTGRRETSLSAISAAQALRALAPSTIFQLPGGGEGAFKLIARVTRKLPCYSLELGTDIPRIPAVILDLLRKSQVKAAS